MNIKKHIKILLKKIAKCVFVFFPIHNYILFESKPDLSDNTKAVFDEMLKRNLNEKYKFIWLVGEENKKYPSIKNVEYFNINKKIHILKYEFLCICSKCLICCNSFLNTQRKGQVSFYLCHGTTVKSIRSYYTLPSDIDYMLIASEPSKKLMSYELNFDINRTYAFGFPRNDILTNININIKNIIKGDFDKIIVWYPTFRQHKCGYNTHSLDDGLPIIHDSETAIRINECAKENRVLIVIKPHFAQDISYIKNYSLSNIIFIDDEFFKDNNISSYEFIGSCDALISDYSSVYFDYLLCDKPMAVAWEDIEEYSKNPGFAIDMDYYLKGAEKIYTVEDFIGFIENVSNDNDRLKEEREEICKWANYSNDGKNASRVVDFIIEKAKL